ncbi:MAG: radical SAM protein [Phycisphaerae bacterium]|jgi:radical SAM superfamily enzyme YgiQ (UPF0313 family)
MKIQFLNPSIYWYSGFQYKMLPPLSLPILSSVFRQAGHEAEVADLEALGIRPEALTVAWRNQRDRWPDAVGITGLTITQRGMQATIKALRDAGYDRPIIAGGVQLSLNPQDGLDWGADLVVTGECEGNVVELVASGARGIHQGRPMPIEDLPLPDWDHHNPRVTTYEANLEFLRPSPSIAMWTRGCPFSCIYCGNTIFGGQKTRYRPPANIIAEMTDLAQRGAKHCFVYDDEMVGTAVPDGWMGAIADGIEHLGIRWITQGRCSRKHVTRQLLEDMKRAGCFYVLWGVESFSQKVLNHMRKGITPEDVDYVLRLSKEVGIKAGVFTMIGNYGETEEDIAITADALQRLHREGLYHYRQTTICTAMPGTRLAEMAQAEGWYEVAPDEGTQMLQVKRGPLWVSGPRLTYWLHEIERRAPRGDYPGVAQ